MTRKVGFVMDPIESINTKKDSSFAMMLEAQRRGWAIYYMKQSDLFLQNGNAMASMAKLKVIDDTRNWFNIINNSIMPLKELDVVLMRKNPPFDMEYIYTTYLLEYAEQQGALVINKPQSLRDANEKIFTACFTQCTPPTLVTSKAVHIKEFLEQHGDIILKPPDGMGGKSIFRVRKNDPNINVIIETLTGNGSQYAISQQYIPEITQGDKRILLVNGEPVPYALARIPSKGETRGNLAVGGTGKGVELTQRDLWICNQVAPVLREKGLVFVGIDVIGDFMTEINVTSPTCIRELDAIYSLNISGILMDYIDDKLNEVK
ncbi:MAG: glutathione synthase [Gammaproteobacteria bacterium]|nr:glutathione synthase [Gammaproteobacteria bacterium]